LIVIDDGSKDAFYDIVKEIAMWDKRIFLIRQDILELAKTRNSRLQIATEGYIAYLDSDDCIFPRSLKKLYHEVKFNNADVVMGNTLFSFPKKLYNFTSCLTTSLNISFLENSYSVR